MKELNIIDWIAFAILLIAGLNTGVIGLFDFNVLAGVFGKWQVLLRSIYFLIGVATVWIIYFFMKDPL